MKLKQVDHFNIDDAIAANRRQQEHHAETQRLIRQDAGFSLPSDGDSMKKKAHQGFGKKIDIQPTQEQLEYCKSVILAGMANQSSKRPDEPMRLTPLTAAEIEKNRQLASNI